MWLLLAAYTPGSLLLENFTNVFHHIPETLSYHLLVGGVIEIMAVVEGDGLNLGIIQQPAGIPPRHDVSNVVILGVQEQGIGVTRGHVPELTEVVGVHTCIIQHVLDIGGPIDNSVHPGHNGYHYDVTLIVGCTFWARALSRVVCFFDSLLYSISVLCRDDAIGVTDPRRLLAAALLGLVHGVREVRHPPLSRGLHPNEHA